MRNLGVERLTFHFHRNPLCVARLKRAVGNRDLITIVGSFVTFKQGKHWKLLGFFYDSSSSELRHTVPRDRFSLLIGSKVVAYQKG